MLSYSPSPAANAYAAVGLQTGVAAAPPHKLILMLFEGAMLEIARARNAIAMADVAEKGRAISKAIQIIDEGLKASVDDRGGSLPQQLRSLYDYMARRLLLASLKSDTKALDEVTRLLGELKDAWQAIEPGREAA